VDPPQKTYSKEDPLGVIYVRLQRKVNTNFPNFRLDFNSEAAKLERQD